MQPDDRPSITPLLAPSTTHSPAADQAWHVVNPVRVLSIRDVAKLALRNRRPNSDGDGMADSPTAALPSVADTFVAREAVDHPWRGRRETWYDYLMGDIPHWRRVVWLHLPLQFLGACAVTVGLGLLIKNDSAASRQIGALSAPVSAFSLLTSLILTFRHSVAYSRFWDGKNFTTSMLSSLRYVAFAFVDAPLEHRRQIAAMAAALMDGYARSMHEVDPTDAAIFERSPPGPWRECARASLPVRLRERLNRTPGCLVATVVGEMSVCPAMCALDGCLRGMVLAELTNVSKMSASALAMSLMPVPPIYTVLLQAMITSFTFSLALLTALSLSQWQSLFAWGLSAATVGLIHTVLYTFYKAARELAKPFCGKLQIPLRMYEAALLHDVYCTLQPITDADLADGAAV